MSVSETVGGQSSSYRRGLVLGLTMAEVILLIVFALLMALAPIWRADREEKMELQKKLDVALESVSSTQNVPALSEAEKEYVSELKAQMQGSDPSEIDTQWRELVVAASVKNLRRRLEVAEAVRRVDPEMDATKVEAWIALGQRANKEGEHDWPPIINLHEAQGYAFAKGKAELTPSFEQKLKSDIIPQLLDLTRRYRVDVIEVIGHTDEQAIAQRPSNLDHMLLDTLKGTGPITNLVHADNAGLGLSRAVSVVRALLLDGRLPQTQYRVLPLSGGQLIETDERLATGDGGDVPGRRRIEIRLRRSQDRLGRKP
jgi:hypothetical protein